MYTCNLMNNNQLQAVHHPSITLLNQSNLEQTTLSVSARSYDAIIKQVVNFKKVYGDLHSAAIEHPTTTLIDFIKQDCDAELVKLSAQLSDQLCRQAGAVILKNFPIILTEDEIKIATFILGCYLGIPMYNNRDRVFIWPVIARQIESSKDLQGNIRYGNTGAPLNFHTDTNTFAGLLCLKQAQQGGENLLISTIAVHNKIYETRPDLLEVLYSFFYIDRRGEQMDGEEPFAKLPVFGLNDAGELMTHWTKEYILEAYNKYEIPPLTATQHEAIDCLLNTIEHIAAEDGIELRSEPGDMLLVNNNLIFHSRKPFVGDRHLLRLWVHSDQYESFPHMFGYSYL